MFRVMTNSALGAFVCWDDGELWLSTLCPAEGSTYRWYTGATYEMLMELEGALNGACGNL